MGSQAVEEGGYVVAAVDLAGLVAHGVPPDGVLGQAAEQG